MADLHDDRKKEEEEYGGFEPDENDDESFMLEDENDYPAKLPNDFSDVPSSPEKVTTSSESDEDEPDDEIDQKDEENSSEDSSEEIEEISDNDEIEDTTPEVEEIEEIEEPIADEIEDEEIAEDETIELGDDFKKKLQEDIEKSKAKREAQEIAENDESDEPIKKVSAPIIGDDAETVVMLTDIEADKPSNAKSEESEPEVQQPPITGNVPESKEGEKSPQEEEKENKKTPIWILMLYSSVATFILTVGLAALIWYMMSGTTDEHDDSSGHTEQLAENNHSSDEHNESKDNSHALASKPDSISKEEMNWLDSMEMDKSDTSLTYKEDKEFFASLEDEFDEEDLAPEKNEEKKTEPKKKENKKTHPKKVTPKKESSDLASNNNTKSIVPKENKKSKITIDESQFSMPQPKGPVPEKGTFTVQIYSSPSREDAESWLGQLKAQEIPYAMIAEQDIKGRTWYRVRYGKFETKEAARASALELGYSQSWIDRVK